MTLDKWIGLALSFLALGTISSPTIVAGFHIFILIPALIIYRKKLYPLKISKSSWVLIILFVWGIISGFANFSTLVNYRKSFDDLKYYFLGFFLIIPLRYYFDRVNSFKVKRLLNLFFITLILAFFIGISKAWFHFNPVTMKFGEFGNRSGGFTNYMRYGYASAFLTLLFTSMYFNRDKLQKFLDMRFFYPAWLLSFLAIFTSQTRGAFLGLVVSLPILFYKYERRLFKMGVLFGIIFLTAVGIFSINKKGNSRFLNVNDGSNYVRMSQFYSAYKALLDNPVFGLGPDQFSYNVKAIKAKHDIWAKDYEGHAHNIILEHLADYGFMGGILIVLFFLFWFFEMVKYGGDFGLTISSYIIAFMVSGQVENLFDNTNSHLLFFIYSFSMILFWRKFEKAELG